MRRLEIGERGEVGGPGKALDAGGGVSRRRRRSLCPVVSALGQLPLSNPSRHMENGVMKQRSED